MLARLVPLVCLLLLAAPLPAGVFVRFQLVEPKEADYYLVLGGYIHRDPWYLPRVVLPEGADRKKEARYRSGTWTPWFDLGTHAGKRLHGRLNRAGGVAEFPNVTADVKTSTGAETVTLRIELADEADEKAVRKRFEETFTGTLTSFLVSPTLARDADSLETAGEMTARRLAWAKEASGGKAVAPRDLIVQTNFWGPQRAELNLREAEILRLLGFNVVGNQPAEVKAKGWFRVPGHTHDAPHGLGTTPEQIDAAMQRAAKAKIEAGLPFNFSDEICAGDIGKNPAALANFHAWLREQKIPPGDLGAAKIEDAVPIETPDVLRERLKENPKAAARLFYLTSRFRQVTTTDRFRVLTERYHQHAGPGALTSTLLADHPYFSGTGLGMGMGPNPAWGRPALAADWFDLARRRAVDLVGIEDWMGLQYMYGAGYTWEGFQLMGFQASMIRSGGRDEVPCIAWITPSDAVNFQLKAASSLAQGAKHVFFWTYGPTATGTENYWSDLRGAHEGIVAHTRRLAAAEHLLAPGRLRPTRIAILYAISSDLWQPFGYVPMLDRRGTYLSLTHEQHRVDFLTEEDVIAGRLTDYDVLITCDPCIHSRAIEKIRAWVEAGGRLQGHCAAGSRNEFNEEVPGLASVFGLEPDCRVTTQPGRYHIRAALNGMTYLDEMTFPGNEKLGVLGVQVRAKTKEARVLATFRDGSPAATVHMLGKGRALWYGAAPGVTAIKEARFVAAELKEQWQAVPRAILNETVRSHGPAPAVKLSQPVIEAGVYDAPEGTALVLGNFTYQPIDRLRVELPLRGAIRTIRSCEQGPLKFTLEKRQGTYPLAAVFEMKLGTSDIVLAE